MGADFTSIDAVEAILSGQGYAASRPLATGVFLAMKLRRRLFAEGEAGVGMTAIARGIAAQ